MHRRVASLRAGSPVFGPTRAPDKESLERRSGGALIRILWLLRDL